MSDLSASHITGGALLVKMLAAHDTSRVACVAGESYLAVLDALLDFPQIEVITCRQEGGAAFMAESWGKLDGKPGICFVTRGPGACNASIGVHTAMQDSTPMILFMGQVARADKGREAFQEIDVPAVFGGLAKWAVEIDDASRIPEIIARAFTIATSGRPGPVVIGLPEDMLTDRVPVPDVLTAHGTVISEGICDDTLTQIRTQLDKARLPLAIIGGSGWDDAGIAAFAHFAEQANIPVAASFRRQDLFDHNSDFYVGELGTGPNPKLLQSVLQADLLLVVGARMNEIATQGYSVPHPSVPEQTMIHIHPSLPELNKVYRTDLAICADLNRSAEALARGTYAADNARDTWRKSLRADYVEWSTIDLAHAPQWNGADMHGIFAWLRDHMDKDAVITTDAGNFSGWAQRYMRYGRPNRLLAPTSGAMGYAVPSAIGASLAHPGRMVIGMCGDGGFMMTGQEIATAMHHGAQPIIMVCNNQMYGTIRMHQQRHYPDRISATALTNPDFVKLAESYGAFAARISDAKDFPAAFEAARNSGKLALLEIAMDPRQITTSARI